MQPYRPWRFGGPYRDPGFAAAGAREVYQYYYRQRYPLDVSEAGRPKRLGPLHGRLQELGAVFGTKNGWERADYFRPGEAWRRAGEEQRGFGWTRPPYHDRVAVEHAAIRERVGIVDLTSFGKLEVSGSHARGAARARLRQPHRRARRLGRLHAAARRARRHRRRRDRHAARRRSLPRRHRCGRRRLRPRLPRAERRRGDRRTSPTSSPSSASGGPLRARRSRP